MQAVSPALDHHLAELRRSIELTLDRFLAGRRSFPERLRKAVIYAALGGGKRLRPVLALLCAEAVGGDPGRALPAAGAVELVHAFSLVHDDLPALDNDDFRRGRPTLHRQFDEATAVLAGDALLTLGLQLLLEDHQPAPIRLRLIDELTSATALMIAGQVEDTINAPPAHDDDRASRLLWIHRHKTGALLRAGCRMGAIAVEADEAAITAVTGCGEAIGLMFQIIDDLLDLSESREHLGKTPGKDAKLGKLTYPAVFGIDGSRAEVERLKHEALDAIRHFDAPAAEHLRGLVTYLAARTS